MASTLALLSSSLFFMVDFEEHILISFLLPRFQDCQEVQNKPNNKPGAKVVTKVTMHADGWAPDIVVGIDFGMTCTGKCC